MAPDDAQADPAPEAAGGRITISFPSGKVDGIRVDILPTTTDAQLYSAAWLLDAMAHEVRAQLNAQAARAQLVKAGPADLAALAAALGVKPS